MRARPLIVSDQAYTKLLLNRIRENDAGLFMVFGGNYFDTNLLSNKANLPLGLERWSRFYSNYTILGTRITVSPIWQDPTVGVPIRYVLFPVNQEDNPPSSNASFDELGEIPYSRYQLYRGPGQSRGQQLTAFMSTNKIMGQKTPYARIEDEVSGEFTAANVLEPARTWFWNLRVVQANGSNLNAAQDTALFWNIRIRYYIRFFGRQNFPAADPALNATMELENKFKTLCLLPFSVHYIFDNCARGRAAHFFRCALGACLHA